MPLIFLLTTVITGGTGLADLAAKTGEPHALALGDIKTSANGISVPVPTRPEQVLPESRKTLSDAKAYEHNPFNYEGNQPFVTSEKDAFNGKLLCGHYLQSYGPDGRLRDDSKYVLVVKPSISADGMVRRLLLYRNTAFGAIMISRSDDCRGGVDTLICEAGAIKATIALGQPRATRTSDAMESITYAAKITISKSGDSLPKTYDGTCDTALRIK